jgi:chromosome segregation ATPase
MPPDPTTDNSFVYPEAKAAVEAEIIANKEIRRDLDAQLQKVKSLPKSRERALSITKLQEAVMWLGMDLKRINEENPGAQENPYPNSKDPSNTKIDPTADGLKL